MINSFIILTKIIIAYRLHFINIPNHKNERYLWSKKPVSFKKQYAMNYQQVVSVCSHTGLVILLVAGYSSNNSAYNQAPQPETKVIVVKSEKPV